MKILYAYFKSCGNHRDFEANFSSGLRFKFDYQNARMEVQETKDNLADGFWSVCEGGAKNVECVSAIIGKNGSGKTSLARRFMDVFSTGRTVVEHLLIIAKDDSLIVHGRFKQEMFDQVVLTIQNASNKRVEPRLATQFFKNDIDELVYLYISPYFCHKKPLEGRVSKQRNCFDLSTTELVRKAIIDHADRAITQYYFDELRRVLVLLYKYNLEQDSSQIQTSVLKGSRLYVTPLRNSFKGVSNSANGQINLDDKCAEYIKVIGRAEKGRIPEPQHEADLGLYIFCSAFSAYVIDFILGKKKVSEELESDFSKLSNVMEGIANKEINSRKLLLHKLNTLSLLDAQLSKRMVALVKVIGFIDYFASRIRHKTLRLPLMEINKEFFDTVLDFVGEYSNAVEKTEFLRFDLNYQPSSGEMSFLSIWGRLYEFLLRKDLFRQTNHLIVFLDELEITLHPAWQQLLVDHMVWFFEKLAPSVKVHIIFASHSPILLSDIPKDNVVLLDKKRNHIEWPDGLLNSFGANIFDLYRLPFMLESGTTGAFAQRKIDAIVNKIYTLAMKRNARMPNDDNYADVANMVGDDSVRKYLLEWINALRLR